VARAPWQFVECQRSVVCQKAQRGLGPAVLRHEPRQLPLVPIRVVEDHGGLAERDATPLVTPHITIVCFEQMQLRRVDASIRFERMQVRHRLGVQRGVCLEAVHHT
tara:strand:- start:41 stop:358 length:318 start_codon:yes stop_codon:yes gene_type:complete